MQVLRLWQGREACSAWPSSTPGKVPLAERGLLGLLQHQLKLYSRGEVQQLEWLDTLLLRVSRAAGWLAGCCPACWPGCAWAPALLLLVLACCWEVNGMTGSLSWCCCRR